MNATQRYYWFCRGENDSAAKRAPLFGRLNDGVVYLGKTWGEVSISDAGEAYLAGYERGGR